MRKLASKETVVVRLQASEVFQVKIINVNCRREFRKAGVSSVSLFFGTKCCSVIDNPDNKVKGLALKTSVRFSKLNFTLFFYKHL